MREAKHKIEDETRSTVRYRKKLNRVNMKEMLKY